MEKVNREQIMYDVLKRIAKAYDSPERIRRDSEKRYGLPYEEALEYAYVNIKSDAAAAIHGMRRPKGAPHNEH